MCWQTDNFPAVCWNVDNFTSVYKKKKKKKKKRGRCSTDNFHCTTAPPSQSTLSITGFVIQPCKHELGTNLNEGKMLTLCSLLFLVRHQRITPFSFSLRPAHEKKKIKSTMLEEDLRFGVYQMKLKKNLFSPVLLWLYRRIQQDLKGSSDSWNLKLPPSLN